MDFDYTNLYLINNPYYTYKQSLNKTDYNITIRYSSRETCWYMDLADADTTPLVLGTKIVPHYPMLLDFVIEGLDGFFWLSPDIESNLPLFYSQPENIPDFFTLRYIFNV